MFRSVACSNSALTVMLQESRNMTQRNFKKACGTVCVCACVWSVVLQTHSANITVGLTRSVTDTQSMLVCVFCQCLETGRGLLTMFTFSPMFFMLQLIMSTTCTLVLTMSKIINSHTRTDLKTRTSSRCFHLL